jgi:hypothetical protein
MAGEFISAMPVDFLKNGVSSCLGIAICHKRFPPPWIQSGGFFDLPTGREAGTPRPDIAKSQTL